MHILVGKTLVGIRIASDNKALLFQTTDGDVIARCDADCCSSTWVESVQLPALGFPCVVISADDIEMPDLGQMPDKEVVAYYGFKVVTDKGEIVIDYRNESNGYYGGNLSWPDDQCFYGGVYGQNVSNEEWQDISHD